MAEKTLAQRVVDRYNKLLQKRDPWRNIFTLLAKYILMRPAVFGDQISDKYPKFSVKDVSDDEVIEAARTAATALGGALWPNAAESFELVPLPQDPPATMYDIGSGDTEDLQKYWEKVTRIMREKIDSPDSGFLLAWSEYMDDQPVFGTSGIYGVEREDDDMQPFSFRSIGVENAVIDEGPDGLIDTVYLESQQTVRQLVEKYENVSTRTRELYEKGDYDEWVRVVQAIEPRRGGRPGAAADEKPYASVHVEVDNLHVLKNSGMDEMPIFVTRMRKRANELYGRSLGMDALPTVKEMNILRASFTKALDKILNPPVGFYSEQIGGAGTVDLSAGAKVALFVSGRIPQGQRAVEPLLTVQEPRVASERLEQMVERIRSKFLVDRLLDFNNKTRMTLGEAELRNDFRNQALNNIFVRQIIELLHPLIRWAYKVMNRRKLLGLHPVNDAQLISNLQAQGFDPLVIPTEVASLLDRGRVPFVVRFISPAARAMKAESMLGIEKVTNYALTLVTGGATDILDNIDIDKTTRLYLDLSGAPTSMLRSPDDVKKLRQARQEALVQQAQLQQAQMGAQAASQGAKAYRDIQAADNGK